MIATHLSFTVFAVDFKREIDKTHGVNDNRAMVKLPALPNPDKALSFFDTASDLIDRGLSVIDKVSNKLDRFAESPQKAETTKTTTSALKTAPGASGEAPETPHTLEYQLDLLLDDLSHLETEHLPAKGRLLKSPCDCIAKASRSLRRHARETIPIAGREGKKTSLFDAIAEEADYLMGIGTLEGVKSGKYDAEYLSHAGVISNFRKSVDKMLAEVKSGPDCPECEELRRLSRLISQSPVVVNTALTKEELTIDTMKIGDKVTGRMYGKPKLQGEVIAYEHPEIEGRYILNDIVTVKWEDGQTSKLYRKDFRD